MVRSCRMPNFIPGVQARHLGAIPYAERTSRELNGDSRYRRRRKVEDETVITHLDRLGCGDNSVRIIEGVARVEVATRTCEDRSGRRFRSCGMNHNFALVGCGDMGVHNCELQSLSFD